MSRARVLVVDGSAVVRRGLAEAIETDPALEVVSTAPTGRIALAKVEQVAPDLVTLDVEMPEMDGIETLRRLRAHHPHLPVVMLSTMTARGAAVTLEALMLGANDFVAKPVGSGGLGASMEEVGASLVPKIRALCNIDVVAAARHTPAPKAPTGPWLAPPQVVVVGASTGGPNALAQVVPALPATLGVPVVVVQHMPPVFTRLLADRLDKHSALEVREAREGESLRPGAVWVAPGDYHMALRRVAGEAVLSTNQDPPENSCRPSADVLFRSAAEAYGDRVLAVALTGMGHDGLRGAEAVVAAGGRVLAQDQATSMVWGMPGGVVGAGLADSVVPLDAVAPTLVRRVESPVPSAAGSFERR